MKIGIDLIYENLNKNFSIINKKLRSHSQEYRFPELYTNKIPKSKIVCVVEAGAITSDLLARQDILIVCVGIREGITKEKCQYIMTNGDKGVFAVYSVLVELFNKVSDWKERIYDIYMKNGSLQEIIDASASIFSSEIVYLNSRFEIMAYSLLSDKFKFSKEEYSEWLARKNKVNLKELTMNINVLTANLRKKTPFVFHYNSDNENINYLVATVKEANRGTGQIAVNIGNNDTPTKTQIWLIKFLRKVLERFFRNFLLVDQNLQQNIQGIFYNILAGTQLDREMVEKKLVKYGSPSYEGYICIIVALANKNVLGGAPLIYLSAQIEQILGKAYSIQYDTVIAVLVNVTMNETNIDERLSKFVNLLKSNQLKAGISNEFNDIFKSRLFHLQAKKAYEVGSITSPDKHLYHFKDYAVQYALTYYVHELPVDMICAEGLIHLMEYEKESDVDYCRTLSTFIRNNMNATQTAKMLYIHRSTLLFRLSRIKEILQMDLNDPDDRFYLEISLKLLGKYK